MLKVWFDVFDLPWIDLQEDFNLSPLEDKYNIGNIIN